MRENDRMVEQGPAFVEHGDLAAVSEAGVYRHGPLLAHGGAEQQLAQVLAEDIDRLDVRLLLRFLDHAVGDRGVQQTLERVFRRFLDLPGEGGGRPAVFTAERGINLVCAALGVCVHRQAQITLVLGAQHRQQIMGRDARKGHREIEVAAVFVGFVVVFGRFGNRRDYAARAVDGAQPFAYGRGLAQALRNNVARPGQRFFDAGDLVFDVWFRARDRVGSA